MAIKRASTLTACVIQLIVGGVCIILATASFWSLAHMEDRVPLQHTALLRPPIHERLQIECPALRRLATSPTNGTLAIQPALLNAALKAQDDFGKVILTMGNPAAFINLFPTMLEGMRFANTSGMTHHLVAVATSAHAFELCSRLHSNCVLDDWATSLGNDPGGETQGGGSPGYHRLVWRKPELMRDLVHANISVICMDMDIVVFKNFLQPWVLPYNSGADILVSYHYPTLERVTGHQERMINSGFSFMRATQPSKAFLDAWVHPDRRFGCGGKGIGNQNIMETLLLAHSAEIGVKWVGIPDNVGFTACKDEAGALEQGPTLLLRGILQKVERIQLDEEQKERLTFIHLACFPSPSSTLPDQTVSRALAMKLISNYYITFRNGLSTEHHAKHANRID